MRHTSRPHANATTPILGHSWTRIISSASSGKGCQVELLYIRHAAVSPTTPPFTLELGGGGGGGQGQFLLISFLYWSGNITAGI